MWQRLAKSEDGKEATIERSAFCEVWFKLGIGKAPTLISKNIQTKGFWNILTE